MCELTICLTSYGFVWARNPAKNPMLLYFSECNNTSLSDSSLDASLRASSLVSFDDYNSNDIFELILITFTFKINKMDISANAPIFDHGQEPRSNLSAA